LADVCSQNDADAMACLNDSPNKIFLDSLTKNSVYLTLMSPKEKL